MVGRQGSGHQAAHRVPHHVGSLDAQLTEESGQLGGHLVEDEPRVRMAGAESRQVHGRDAECAGERRKVALPPGTRAGQTMEQHELRTGRPFLRGHDRAVRVPSVAHAYPSAGLRKTRTRPGSVGSSVIGSSAIQRRTMCASCSGCEKLIA